MGGGRAEFGYWYYNNIIIIVIYVREGVVGGGSRKNLGVYIWDNLL